MWQEMWCSRCSAQHLITIWTPEQIHTLKQAVTENKGSLAKPQQAGVQGKAREGELGWDQSGTATAEPRGDDGSVAWPIMATE